MKIKDSIEQVYNEMDTERGFPYCGYCGGSGIGFCFHHIIYRSEAPKHENLNHPRNLLHCHPACHAKLHAKKSLRNPIVQERKLWKLFPEISNKLKNNT